jgi:hypothetical protein
MEVRSNVHDDNKQCVLEEQASWEQGWRCNVSAVMCMWFEKWWSCWWVLAMNTLGLALHNKLMHRSEQMQRAYAVYFA